MSRKKNTVKNPNDTAGNQNGGTKKERRARAIANSELKKELSKEKKASKARKKQRQRIRAREKKEQKRRNCYIDQDLKVVLKKGYICLMGHWVERAALQMTSSVPERALNQRKMRDGYPFHITIANVKQTTQLMRSDKSLGIMNEIAAASSPPVNLGLGMVQHVDNESRSWYCVISWPAGQQIRRYFNLPPRDLHVTLGFDHKDIHDHKGPSTLLTHNIATASLDREQIEGLIYAALLESFSSKECSLKSLSFALAQAKLIHDEALISSAESNIIRVQRRERLKEFEGPIMQQNLENVAPSQETIPNVVRLAAKFDSLHVGQQQYLGSILLQDNLKI